MNRDTLYSAPKAIRLAVARALLAVIGRRPVVRVTKLTRWYRAPADIGVPLADLAKAAPSHVAIGSLAGQLTSVHATTRDSGEQPQSRQ